MVTAVALSQAVYVAEVRAESGKANVAVGGFEGAKSDEVRAAFIEALKKDGGYEVTDAEDIKPSTKGKAMVEAAKGLAVNAVIVGKVSKGGVKLKVFNGADGKVLDEVEIKGAGNKLKTNIEKNGAASVADAFGKAKPKEEEKKKEEAAPAAEAEDKPEEDKPAEDKPADSTPGEGGTLSPFDVTAGLRPLHRSFAFHNTIADVRPNQGFRQLLKYELPLGPLLFVDLNWFPFSHFLSGPAEWVGLTAGFEKGFATQSVYAEGDKDNETTLKTNEQQWYVGARFRLPLGPHTLGLTGTYGQHTFILEGDEGKTGQKWGPLVPDVRYSNIRVGLDGLFRFGDILAGAHVGKRFVTDTGALQTVWFPNVKTSSLEAGVTVGYRLVSMLDLVAGFDWLRYAFDFNPVPKRPMYESYVAGGAVDEYMSGYIAFRFHVPGPSEAAAGGE